MFLRNVEKESDCDRLFRKEAEWKVAAQFPYGKTVFSYFPSSDLENKEL
jgi:hypothetical protein